MSASRVPVLPDFDWLHTFPCRYGNTTPGTRDGSFNGAPVPGTPFAGVIGVRWCSAGLLADAGAPSRFRLAGQGSISQMALRRTGAVSYPSVFIIPLDRLPEAIRHAESLLATSSANAGVREWTPAYGRSEAHHYVGVHVHFVGANQNLQRRAFACTVGADWVIEYAPHFPTLDDPERQDTNRGTDRCTIRDSDGADAAEWTGGVVYLVDSEDLYGEVAELRAAVEGEGIRSGLGTSDP